MLVNRTKSELQPVYDSAKSFYKKAEVEQIEIKGGYKVHLLKSYDSLVSAVIETKAIDGYKYFYLNNLTQKELLTSQTTLRHIKEFYRQFYENETITKAELLKKAMFKNFDFLEVHETEDHIIADIAEYKNYYNCNSPQARAFFKNFKGYRQRQKEDSKGKYLYTSSAYGYSNYYFYYIQEVCKMDIIETLNEIARIDANIKRIEEHRYTEEEQKRFDKFVEEANKKINIDKFIEEAKKILREVGK